MIIGHLKLAEFEPLGDEELAQFRATLVTLLASGESPNTPIGVDIGVLARIFATIAAQAAKAVPVERPALTLEWLVDRPVGDE